MVLLGEERRELEERASRGKTGQRLALRARILLAAAHGEGSVSIAERERLRPATVSKWRGRFARLRMAGLFDKQGRGGKPRCNKQATRLRIRE